MRIVEGLDASARRDIIVATGDLEHCIIGQVVGLLHESFSKGSLANYDGAVEVLQRTAYNLG